MSVRTQILSEHIDDLHKIAKGLLEYETLTGDEIIALIKGIEPVRKPYEEPEPQRGSGPSVPQPAARAASVPSRRSRSRGGEPNAFRHSQHHGGFVLRWRAFLAPEAALEHARALLAGGADVLDLGAASSNPDAKPVAPDVEIARLAPIVVGADQRRRRALDR